MPFCPKCRYEYRPDITRCPDCDVELVDELPQEASVEATASVPSNPVCVGSFIFLPQAQMAKLQLESAGIKAVLSNEIISRTAEYAVGVAEGIKLFVAEEDAAKAVEVLESEQSP